MKKIILLLLLWVSGMTAQVSNGNETYSDYGFRSDPAQLQIPTNVNFLSTIGLDGTFGKIFPENVTIPYVPLNYTVLSPTLGAHLTGIDTKLGTVVATTAGLTTRVWFTADVSVVSATNYYATNATSKGTLASAIQNVVNNDNVKTYFAQDLIGAPFVTATLFPPGIYAGNLSASTSPNSAQQRWTVELYKCDNSGAPIASGVTGAPVGSLGVTVITILDSGLLTLVDGSVTNVQVSGNLGGTGLSMAVGERVRYHVSAEKVGTTGGNITQSVYYGTSYNSYIDVPVPLNTTAVQNLSSVVGTTTTDALNTLNTGKADDANVLHKTLDETKTGTLGVNGIIYNANASVPATTEGIQYKLTQPTTASQSWSKTYYPVFTRANGLTDYVRNKPATFRKKIITYGSSVAYGTGATGNNGWANRLGTDLTSRGFTVFNYSIGGNTVASLIDRFYTDITPENPDFLIIATSLSNEGITGTGKEAKYDVYKKGLQQLVRMCRQHDIIPIISNNYPNNGYTSVEYGYINQINAELDSWGVPVLNLLGAVDDLTGKFVAGSFFDFQHPNDAGHQAMYKAVPPSMFDCLMNWDEKRLVPEKGAISVGVDSSTEKPLEAVFDGDLEGFTASFWFKNNDANASGKTLAGFGTSSSRVANSGGIGLRYITASGGSVNFGVFPEVTKNWYHVAISYNNITQKVRAYLNGVYIGEVTDPITLSRMTIAGRSDTGQASLNSVNTDFKDVAIYRARLNDAQIKELYSGNILKSSLEIFSPLSDKDTYSGHRFLNFSPTYSYLKINSTAVTSKDKGVINSDLNASKVISESMVISTDQVSGLGSKLRIDGNVLPDGAIAKGLHVSTTATATANNDFLSGVYLNPSFNSGAFTGIQSVPLRIFPRGTLGHISLGSTSNAGQISFARGSDGLTQAYVGYNTPSDASDFIISSASVSGTLSFFTNSIRQGQFYNDGKLTLQSGGTFTNNGVDQLQVTGTVSTTVNGTLPNQLVRRGQLDLKADLASPIFTGNPTAPTPTAGDNDTSIATTAFVQANARLYKSYVSSISQGSTSAPTVVLSENQLSGAIVWARSGVGSYTGTLTGAFLSGKVFMHLSNNANNTTGQEIFCVRSNDNVLSLQSFIAGVATDGVINGMSLEIRVYP